MNELLKFYGVDWIAGIFTFFAIWQMGNKNKWGFLIMMFGNVSWMAVGFFSESIAMIVANIVFFSMNLRAILRWSLPQSELSLNADSNLSKV